MIESLLIKKELLVYLSQRERQVIEMRYGLLDGRKMTLQAIGDVFGVCRERVRQIERKAFRKLKHPSRLKKIIRSV